MDFLSRGAANRQQALVEALRTPLPAATAALSAGIAPADLPACSLQPTDPDHPGSAVYKYNDYHIGTYDSWNMRGIAIYPTKVTYLVPKGSLPNAKFPVVVVSPGKFLDYYGWYSLLLRQACLKGFVVIFVDTEMDLLDGDHERMAEDLLKAVWMTVTQKLRSWLHSPPQILWWGHSMGAKVQFIAARKTSNRYFLKPKAILANHFSNAVGVDSLKNPQGVPSDVYYTVIRGDNDHIAGPDPVKLYEAISYLPHRQLISAQYADHLAPLCNPITSPPNNLAWWLYWKFAIGAAQYHFSNGSDKWAYGSERPNGGCDKEGQPVTFKVE